MENTTTHQPTSRRVAPGYYEVTCAGRTFTVSHIVLADEGTGYGARDDWQVEEPAADAYASFDPCPTKREALEAIAAECA